MRPRVLVLGAGIQGSCAALALARAGNPVTLIDRAPAPLLRTSVRNEGKIHLGLVYANDPTGRTGSHLLEHALRFAPLLERFLGEPLDWPSLVSIPFAYLIARDSMVGEDRLQEYYESLQTRYQEILREAPDHHYLGTRPDRLWWPAEVPTDVDPAMVAGAVSTSELAIDRDGLRARIVAALEAHPAIELRMDREVRAAEERSGGFLVEGETGGGEPWSEAGDLLVNCLWAGRIPVDRELGLAPEVPWVHRLKFRVLVDFPEALHALPSLTTVLGAYGDLVNYPDAKASYLSWYPVCLRGFSVGDAPPADWLAATAGRPTPEQLAGVEAGTLEAFARLVPGIEGSRVLQVDGGIICARGERDITDPGSALHERHDIGVTQRGGYFSVSTGKFTSAPSHAAALAETIGALAGRGRP
jgi:glycine/D-amino acid oxidase-like deaminating enzyme